MPVVKYWDYANGNDTTGDGSAANPYKTLNKASTAAGVGGEVRAAGQAIVNVGPAQWTQDSTTVTFDTAPNLSAGDFIRPEVTECPAYRVLSVSGTTVTLARVYRYPTVYCNTHKIPYYVLSGTQSTAAADQTFTFGWRLSDETQPDNYVSAFRVITDGFHGFQIGHRGLWYCDGRLLVLGPGAGSYNAFYISGAGCTYLRGQLDVSEWQYGLVPYISVTVTQPVVLADTVVASYTIYGVIGSWNSTVLCQKVILHNSAGGQGAIYAAGGMVWCDRVEGWGGAYALAGAHSGYARIGTAVWKPNTAPVVSCRNGGQVIIGYLDSPVAPSLSSEATCVVGGPVPYWRYKHGETGTADKVTGRGGSGYGLRIDSTNRLVPFRLPFSFTVSTDATITLSCYAYYTGSLGAPEVWWELFDPQRVGTPEVQPISLPNGTSWSDAQKLTVTFQNVPAQNGIATVLLCVRDVGGDAICYFDDIELSSGSGDKDTMGLEVGGPMLLLQKATVGGGGGGGAVAFPLGL